MPKVLRVVLCSGYHVELSSHSILLKYYHLSRICNKMCKSLEALN